jgi:hypothetical protein
MSTAYKRDDLTVKVRADGLAMDPAEWIVDPDLSGVDGVDPKYWKLGPEDQVEEMDELEKAALDSALLAKAKADAKEACGLSFTSMLYSHYSQESQQSLSTYLSEARHNGLANRAAYILQALGWIDATLTAYYAKKDEIDAAADLDEVAAASVFDWSAVEAADPEVQLRHARTITD